MERSGGKQIPPEYSRLIGEDIFLAGPATPRPSAVAKSPEIARNSEKAAAGETPKPTEDSAPKAQAIEVPTLAQINKLAANGDAGACTEALRAYARGKGVSERLAEPLATLLEKVKESLRNPKTGRTNAPQALQDCDLILSALTDCLPADHPLRTTLSAKAYNRQGDALLELDQAQEALASYNAAASLDPEDGYILYNRGRALLAVDRRADAKADFTAAAGPKFRHSGVHKLAQEALAAMK